MNLVPVLSTVILIATMGTIIIVVGSYLAFKVRESRNSEVEKEEERKQFFIPYIPEDEEIA